MRGFTASTILLMIILEPLLGFFPVEPSLEVANHVLSDIAKEHSP